MALRVLHRRVIALAFCVIVLGSCASAPPRQSDRGVEDPVVVAQEKRSSGIITRANQLARADMGAAADYLSQLEETDLVSSKLRAEYRKAFASVAFIHVAGESAGLSYPNISAIASSDEDLWMGDWLGAISRYDMAMQAPFSVREGKKSLSILVVNSIYTEKNAVWAACGDALVRYTKHTDSIKSFPAPKGSMLTASVRYGDSLYVGTQGQGLWRFLKSERFDKDDVGSAVRFSTVNSLAVIGDQLWVAGDNGLMVFSGQGRSSVTVLAGKNVAILMSARGRVWISRKGEGVSAIDQETLSVADYPELDRWTSCGVDAGDRLIFGSLSGGLTETTYTGFIMNRDKINGISPVLKRVIALSYHAPYLAVGAMGAGLYLVHNSLF